MHPSAAELSDRHAPSSHPALSGLLSFLRRTRQDRPIIADQVYQESDPGAPVFSDFRALDRVSSQQDYIYLQYTDKKTHHAVSMRPIVRQCPPSLPVGS